MVILGIHDGQDASAALVVNGEVVGFLGEARHKRTMEFAGFPNRSVQRLLSDARISPKDIDAVAFAGHFMKSPRRLRDYLEQFGSEDSAMSRAAKRTLRYVIPGAFRTEQRKKDRAAALARAGISPSKATFVDAHLAASMLAYASGPGVNRRCLVICATAGADRLGATVHVAQKGRLERIASILEEDSLGNLLEHVTYMLGMAPQRDAQLLMELGAQAKGAMIDGTAKRFELLFQFDDQLPLNWQRASNMPETHRCQDFLRNHFRRRRTDHIAGGWNRFIARFVTEWLGRCAHKTEIRDIVVCGDLFALPELLPAASRHRDVVSLSVSPLPGAQGNSIGAALLIASEREEGGTRALKPVRHPYLGQSISAAALESAVVRHCRHQPGTVTERPADMPRRVAELLAAGAVLGRCSGRDDISQLGMGNRSILARADHAPAREKIRDLAQTDCFWAGPAIFWAAERLRAAFIEADTLPEAPCGEYALTPRHASPWYGMHEDRKVRVQAISRAANPAFWDVLDAFHSQLGRTPLIAGIWRDHTGGLVRTASTAARIWREQGLSGAILGDWLVFRSDLAVSPPVEAVGDTHLLRR
jgi:carbamoyltransferase